MNIYLNDQFTQVKKLCIMNLKIMLYQITKPLNKLFLKYTLHYAMFSSVEVN